jgi:hypothetical protein
MRLKDNMGVGEQRNTYGTRSITAPLLPNTQIGRLLKAALSLEPQTSLRLQTLSTLSGHEQLTCSHAPILFH